MHHNRPYVLSVAGFDPSAGAGILADIKTFESNNVYGLGAVTALTYQNDRHFEAVEWTDIEKIIRQIDVLLKRFHVRYVKIGIIENMQVLKQLVAYLHQAIQNPIVVFDPILQATAGFDFHRFDGNEFENYLDGIYCFTPNIPEVNGIFGENDLHEKLLKISNKVNVYLKGGHSTGSQTVTDLLFTNGQIISFDQQRIANGAKHGSGCVLSSALTSQLALGNGLADAARRAQSYTHNFLKSNESLLGFHQNAKTYETN